MLPDLAKLATALMAATATGFVMERLGVPAGWLLGALVGAAGFRAVFGPPQFTGKLRRFGQLVVGAAVAGLLTPSVVETAGGQLPLLIGAAVALNLFCFLLSIPGARLAGVDRRTAALSCLPGGLSEMGSLAREVGADEQAVAVFHTIRVTVIVTTVPLLLTMAGFHEVEPFTGETPAIGNLWLLALLVVASAPLAMLGTRIGVVNPWVVTPILLGIALVYLGREPGAMPIPVSIVAQILIGVALGARLDHRRMIALPRVFMAGVAISLILLASTLLAGALLLPMLASVPPGVGAISLAPGGLAELIAVSKAMDLMPTTVAAFGIVRSVLTNTVSAQLVSRIPPGRDPKPDG